MNGSGPDAQMTSVAVNDDGSVDQVEERKLPRWVEDPAESELVWSVYNEHLRGKKTHEIADTHNVSVRTVYNYIARAREELPYHVMNRAAEMADTRMQWVHMAWEIAERIKDSQLRIDRKAEQISKLLNATGAWLTAIEELTGARRGTGSRINIHASGDGQTAVLFDMDKLLRNEGGDTAPPLTLPSATPLDVESRDA